MKTNTIYNEPNLDTMRRMPDNFLHCVVTSPPYWGLRDYGTDGTPWPEVTYQPMPGMPTITIPEQSAQLGLEETPEAFVGHIVHIFREVRRVLREDGTLWLNFGDSYIATKTGNPVSNSTLEGGKSTQIKASERPNKTSTSLKPKDLCGIPWRVAFALQADGWYLRSDIIWAKPNPMPESVTDRPTKAHEYLFLLTKSARYYYDAEAVKESATGRGSRPPKLNRWEGQNMHDTKSGFVNNGTPAYSSRNRRTVWTIATNPYSGAHFAVFPPDLVKPCVLAGSPQRACVECGAGWVREVERTKTFESGSGRSGNGIIGKQDLSSAPTNSTPDIRMGPVVTSKTVGWQPSCDCNAETHGGIVYDPFGGSGTTAEVAHQYGRQWIVSEISEQYVKKCTMPRLEKTKQKTLF